MPPVSQAQRGLMRMASTAAGRAKMRAEGRKPPPMRVAKEFNSADKGGKLPARKSY